MANAKPINTFCNEGCQKPFTITKMPTIRVKKDIEKTYFRCPHCKHEYIAYYASTATKKLQKQMRSLHAKYKNSKGVHENQTHDAFLKQVAELKFEIKKSMDEARLNAGN